jgi:phage baseplate assembly protein W
MTGIDALTGKVLSGLDHLAQSIADILTTPIGTRIGRREYGSMLFQLQDQPMNGLGRMRLFAAVATALARWEPRIRLTRVQIASDDEARAAGGSFAISIEGVSTEEPSPNQLIRFAIPLQLRIPT